MARFDVHVGGHGRGYLLDCQADLLSHLGTRVVVPLLPLDGVPRASRLNPVFRIGQDDVLMSPQLIFAIPRERLAAPVASLADEHSTIMNAINMLLAGI
jgi:toxin CcdB